jgi:FlaA1/EpsC-like NDP-sugar epimerase
MRVFNRYVSQRHLTVFTGETLVIFGSMAFVAHVYRPGEDLATGVWKAAVVTGLCLLCLYYNDCYDLTVVRSGRELVIRLLQAVGTASILIALLYLALPSLVVADGAFLTGATIFLLGILIWRLIFNRIATLQPLGERILIVGTDPAAQVLARQVLAQRDFAYDIVGFIDEDPGRIGEPVVNPRVVGTPSDIERLVERHNVDRIFVALSDRRGRLPVTELLRAKLRGVRVEEVNTVYERLTGNIDAGIVERISPAEVVEQRHQRAPGGGLVRRLRGGVERPAEDDA